MAKNDNPHALRFLESMEKHGEKETAEKFSVEHPLSKSADFNKKYAWAKDICEFLDTNYDEELVKEIRMDCACGPEMGKGNKIKGIYEKETDPYVFVEKTNKLNLGFSLEYDGEAYYLIYPQCYCSCVKRNPEQLSKTWCYCTLGYSKRMFENIFGTEVQVELLSSVKMGDDNCRIRIMQAQVNIDKMC